MSYPRRLSGENLRASALILAVSLGLALVCPDTTSARPRRQGPAASDRDRSRAAGRAALTEGERLHALGDEESLRRALQKYAEAVTLYRSAGDKAGAARALSKLGLAHNDVGEKQKALDHDKQALLLHREAGDRVGEADVLLHVGLVYYSLQEARKALDYYQQALSLSRASGYREGEASALLGLGAAHASAREKQKALDYVHQALTLYRALGARRGEAHALHNLAWLYGDLGEKQKALDYNRQALQPMRDVGDRRGEAYILHSIGWVYDSSGEKQKAVEFYRQALPLRREVGDFIGEADTLYRLARCLHEGGDLPAAIAHVETAVGLVESLRGKIGSPGLSVTYAAHAHTYYEFYIYLLSQMHRLRPAGGFDAAALQISERARARRLLELLAEARADIRRGVGPELLERERHLRQAITAGTDRRIRLLNGKHTREQAAEATKQLEALASAYQEVEAQIRNTSPRYAALTQPRPLTLPEIQRQLDSDTVLLEYALGGERSHLWLVTPASIESFELEKASVINDAAQCVYDLLTARSRTLPGETAARRRARVAEADARYPAASAKLSRLLLAPVAPRIGGKRLVVVADGLLQYIPFAALPEPSAEGGEPESGGQPSEAGRPLIVGHEIVSLPSASTLAQLRRDLEGRRQPTKAVAVFADPVFEATDLRVIRKSNRGGRAPNEDARLKAIRDYLLRAGVIEEGRPLARLPYSRKEALAIASLVPEGERKIALDFDANYGAATDAGLGEYRFVHFATHGLLDTGQPELSGILLSLVDAEGRPRENGVLRLGDIYNLKLPVEMVSLSACETALGKPVRGEGLVGLTRGFMYAGAPRVLASLWKVEEVATAELMAAVYEGILGGRRLRPAEALRRAQIEMWRDPKRRAPYYWSAFVLQGEWR
jgi:CHAT domain-containing protein